MNNRIQMTVGNQPVYHDHYLILVDNKTINIIFTKNDTAYDIEFSDDVNIKQAITIDGGERNEVVINKAKLKCDILNLNVDVVILEENLELTTNQLNMMTSQLQLYGKLKAEQGVIHVRMNEPGVMNNGVLIVHQSLTQRNGAFINNGKFDVKNFTMELGRLCENTATGEWNVKGKQMIQAMTFLNNGFHYARISDLHCFNITIDGIFGGTKFQARADGGLVFKPSAKCTFHSMLVTAYLLLKINGYFYKCKKLQFVGHGAEIGAGTTFNTCHTVKVYSHKKLKLNENVKFEQVKHFVAYASVLFINSLITAKRSVRLSGAHKLLVAKVGGADTHSITLIGAKVYLYGTLSGNITFANQIKHLYLAEKSLVKKCKRFAVKCEYVAALGAIDTELNQLFAECSVDTGPSTYINSLVNELSGQFVTVDGKQVARNNKYTAQALLELKERLEVDGQELKAIAQHVEVNGQLLTNAAITGVVVNNQAVIKNQGKTRIIAQDVLRNSERSVIDSTKTTLSSNSIQHHGVTNGDKARLHGRTVYVGKDAAMKHRTSTVEGDEIGVAGELNNRYTLVKASKTIRTYKSGRVNGGVLSVNANDSYDGDADVDVNDITIVTGNTITSTADSMKSKQSTTLSSRKVFTDTKHEAHTFKVMKQKNHENTAFMTGTNSAIDGHTLVVTQDHCTLGGKSNSQQVLVNNENTFKALSGSHVQVTHQLQVKTKDCHVGGQMTQQGQAIQTGEKEDELNDKHPVSAQETNQLLQFEANTLKFAESSETASQVAVVTTAAKTSLAGVHREKKLILNTEKGLLNGNLHVTNEVDLFQVIGRGEQPVVEMEAEAIVASKKALIENCDLTVAGKFTPEEEALFNRIKTLAVLPSGVIGTMQSKVVIQAEHMRHHGSIEGQSVNIKCSKTFMMLFNGKQASVKATKLNINTLFYLDVLGLTEAQQSNLSSLLALSAGIRMVNFDIKNSAFDFEILPTMPHVGFLTNIIDDIKNGNITITKSEYAIYSMQTLLAGLKLLLPKMTMVAGIALNVFFICRNLINLIEMLKQFKGKEFQAVDLLPMFITAKNIVLSAANGAGSVESMYSDLTKLGLPAFIEKLGNDIESEVTAIKLPEVTIHSVADALAEPVLVAANDILKMVEQGVNSAETLIPSLKKLDLGNTIKTAETTINANIDTIKQENPKLDEVLSSVVLPVASVFMPSSYHHSLVGVSAFAPVLSFSSNHTSVVGISAFSPSIAAITTKNGYGFLANIGPDFSISESLTGHEVYQYGNQHPHSFMVSATNFYLLGTSAILACDVSLDVSNLKPVDVKALTNLSIKYDKVDDEADLLELKGKWGIFLTDKDKPPMADVSNQNSGYYNPQSKKQTKSSSAANTKNQSIASLHTNVTKIINALGQDDISKHKHEDKTKGRCQLLSKDENTTSTKAQHLNYQVDTNHESYNSIHHGKKSHKNHEPAQAEPFSSTLNVSIETSHPLHFSKEVTVPWSITYKAPEVTVTPMTKMISYGGKLALVSTNGNLEMDGELTADVVLEISSDVINQKFGKTTSIYLYVLALGDINLDQSDNQSHNGVVQSYGGNIVATAAQVVYQHFGVVQAYDTITAKCISRSTVSMPGFMLVNNDKTYYPTVFKGGDGQDHNGAGLLLKADTIINDASTFDARANVFVSAHHNLILREQHNPTVSVDQDTSWWGETSTTVTYSVKVQHPTIQSEQGSVYMDITKGTIDSVAGVFVAAKSVYLHTNYGPVFRDIVIQTITKESDSWLGLIQLSSDENITTQMMGQIFVTPESLHIRTEHGDIVIPNTNIHTGLLVTDAPEGNTVIYQTPIDHVEIIQYLTLSMHLGPINLSYSFNPKEEKPAKIWVSDPLLNAEDGVGSSPYKGEDLAGASNLINPGAAKMNAYHDKKPLIDLSLGSNVSDTTTVIHETLPGTGAVVAGVWVNHGKGISVIDTPVYVGALIMDDGGTLSFKGGYFNQSMHSTTLSAGMNWSPITNQVDVNAAYASTTANARIARPCIINIEKLHFRNQLIMNLDNAQVHINQVDGDEISRVSMQSHYSDSLQHSDAASLGTDYSYSLSHHVSTTHTVAAPATLAIKDLGTTKIDEVDSNGGVLQGAALANAKNIHQTNMVGSHTESGFAIAGAQGHVVSSVGVTQTVDTTVNGAVTQQQGTKFNVDVPYETYNLIKTDMQRNQPQNAGEVDTDDTDHLADEVDTPATTNHQQASAANTKHAATGKTEKSSLKKASEKVDQSISINARMEAEVIYNPLTVAPVSAVTKSGITINHGTANQNMAIYNDNARSNSHANPVQNTDLNNDEFMNAISSLMSEEPPSLSAIGMMGLAAYKRYTKADRIIHDYNALHDAYQKSKETGDYSYLINEAGRIATTSLSATSFARATGSLILTASLGEEIAKAYVIYKVVGLVVNRTNYVYDVGLDLAAHPGEYASEFAELMQTQSAKQAAAVIMSIPDSGASLLTQPENLPLVTNEAATALQTAANIVMSFPDFGSTSSTNFAANHLGPNLLASGFSGAPIGALSYVLDNPYRDKFGIYSAPPLFYDVGVPHTPNLQIEPTFFTLESLMEKSKYGIFQGIYVVDADGTLYLSEKGFGDEAIFHSDLSPGPVPAAGEFTMYPSNWVALNNKTGHFMVYGDAVEQIALYAFKKAGFENIQFEKYSSAPAYTEAAVDFILNWCKENAGSNQSIKDLTAKFELKYGPSFVYKNPDKLELSDFFQDAVRQVDPSLLPVNDFLAKPKSALYLMPPKMAMAYKSVGGAFVVMGMGFDAYDLYQQIQISRHTGNYNNSNLEGTRIVEAWTGSVVGGELGAEIGALVCAPFVPPVGPAVCASIGSVAGSVGGYTAGSKGSVYIAQSVANRPASIAPTSFFYRPAALREDRVQVLLPDNQLLSQLSSGMFYARQRPQTTPMPSNVFLQYGK